MTVEGVRRIEGGKGCDRGGCEEGRGWEGVRQRRV